MSSETLEDSESDEFYLEEEVVSGEHREAEVTPTEESAESTEYKKRSRPTRKSSSGLRAGFSDDNKQFNYYLNFLKEYAHAPHLSIDVYERI